ncbi:MAG TPA: 50S ribosomal protein L1, partial [Phycisphaerales bacterium]|nr:50S ribosomal protein L1 [Phycisphaerales bacterium]
EFRNDKAGNVHAILGKLSFKDSDLVDNLNAFIDHIEKMRPSSTKGVFVKKIVISGAMTPGVQIKHVSADVAAEKK